MSANRTLRCLAVIGVLHARLAVADEPADAGVDAAPAPPAEAQPPAPAAIEPVEPTHEKHKKEHPDAALATAAEGAAKKSKHKKLEFGGRIFARSSLVKAEEMADVTAQSTLQSARAGVDYRSHNIRAQLEVELSGKAQIKDAYVQLRLAEAPKLDVRAGHFKMPFSAIQLESIWGLPMADRGVVDNVLVKRLQVAGRAVGAMAALDLGAPYHPAVRAGVFQGTNDAGDPLDRGIDDGFAHDAVLRFSIKPAHPLELGAAGSVRSGSLIEVPVEIRRGYAGQVDATLDVAAGPGQVRAWLEAMIGTSWLVGGPLPGHELTRFLEARSIVAYRFGGAEEWDRYVELYGLAAALDPDRIIDRDRIVELTGGITYGASDVWRVQLEAEVWRFGGAAPLGIAEFAATSKDSTTFLVQLGARL